MYGERKLLYHYSLFLWQNQGGIRPDTFVDRTQRCRRRYARHPHEWKATFMRPRIHVGTLGKDWIKNERCVVTDL